MELYGIYTLCQLVLSQRLGLGKGGLRMAAEEALQEILQVCFTIIGLYY